MLSEIIDETLYFIFTEHSFFLDETNENLSEKTKTAWAKNPYFLIYQEAVLGKMNDSSPSHIFLYQVATCFFRCLTALPELELLRENTNVVLSDDDAEDLLNAVPYALGEEFITRQWLEEFFLRLQKIFSDEISHYSGSCEMYITEKCQNLHIAERVFFHLVENKNDADFPFAFLATYATKTDAGKAKHVPLQYALIEYKNDRQKLLALLACLNKAADVSTLINSFIVSGELFHPIKLSVNEAYQFLKDVDAIEKAGILCRIPNWWKKKSSSVSLSVKLGEQKPSLVGFASIITMQPSLTVDGVELTKDDIKMLLSQTDGLAFLKGKWIEIDHARLASLLEKMESSKGNITLLDALKMATNDVDDALDSGKNITNGKWLSELLRTLRNPEKITSFSIPETITAHLRPYQEQGYNWLMTMASIGFGSCLADDMGLGKTLQVLTFLENMRISKKNARVLLIVPASLLNNWQKEQEKFAPKMNIFLLHGKSGATLDKEVMSNKAFLTITTYGMAVRLKSLEKITWDCVILDEAQAIKNPKTKQTKSIKNIPSLNRIAMTGTPIENDLSNLWSLFDFIDKGLMGTVKEFQKFCNQLNDNPKKYSKLKNLVAPFMLRRVKTDKRIIADLPDKLETIDYATLSKKQVVLYRELVENMAESLETSDGIKRKGLILSTIMKLKQICNHPDQYLGQSNYAIEESGKFELLKELCETIYEKRERVLVFTQFKEITKPIADFLETIFHIKGFVLHGGTQVKKRGEIVEAFQSENYVPFIILSVKAGGTGLNLTKANHVIHFDRWWNPAVENQATDRAFRIGQTKNVLVHKLVCRGTIEEKIDALIESKKELAQKVIAPSESGEKWITQLGNEELLSLLKLN